MARCVPEIGNVEMALLNAEQPVPQPPGYLTYWHDPSLHAMVGLHIGVDLVHHQGKYYVIENNIGPSIYGRRRALYDTPFDPIVSAIASTAVDLGFKTVVPAAFKWEAPYIEEFERAGREHDLNFRVTNCPFEQPGTPHRMTMLPQPLERETMYVIHAGLRTPVIRYIDNKWYTSRWLAQAIRDELPADTPLAIPATHDRFTFPLSDHGPRWPNLIIKLANSARSSHVIAARFDDEREARETLGLNGLSEIPRKIRLGLAMSRLVGADRVLYQEFIPQELDERQRAQVIRLHLLVTPLRTQFLSAHLRISQQSVPQQVPRGIIQKDDTYIFNDALYARTSPEMEEELRVVADHLGGAMQRAIGRKFETGPASRE